MAGMCLRSHQMVRPAAGWKKPRSDRPRRATVTPIPSIDRSPSSVESTFRPGSAGSRRTRCVAPSVPLTRPIGPPSRVGSATATGSDGSMRATCSTAATSISITAGSSPAFETLSTQPGAAGLVASVMRKFWSRSLTSGLALPSMPKVVRTISSATSKLRKRDALAAYLRALAPDDLQASVTFFAGRPLPGAGDRLGLGWVQQAQSLGAAAQAEPEALRAAYLRHSDFGDAAAELLANATPGEQPLTPAAGRDAFRVMSETSSTEARVAEMTRLFERASPGEARYVARIAARELRIGLREGLLEEAIAAAFERPLDAVRRAHMLLGEPGEAAP